MNSVRSSRTNLTKLRRDLDVIETMRTRVGLFGEDAQRTDGKSNPEIGLFHEQPKDVEFGSTVRKLPQRSFLRMPLMTQLTPKRLAEIPWLEIIQRRGAKQALKLLGIVGEEVVQEAFATGGYGNWPALAPSTVAKKGSSAILIDKAEMRKAITSIVVTL